MSDTTFGLFWKIIGTDPFNEPFDFGWEVEFGEPDPTGLLTWQAARVATRPRLATAVGRYP